MLRLCPGIFGGVGQILGLVIGDVRNAEVLHHFKQGLAAVGEGHGAVVGIALLNEHVAIETAHLGDGKHADAAKGAGGHGQHLTLGDVGAQIALAVTLQAVEGDRAGAMSPSRVPRVKSGVPPFSSRRFWMS